MIDMTEVQRKLLFKKEEKTEAEKLEESIIRNAKRIIRDVTIDHEKGEVRAEYHVEI